MGQHRFPVCLTSVFGDWSFWSADNTRSQTNRARLARKHTTSKSCSESKTFLRVPGEYVLARHELVRTFDGGG